MYYSIFRASFPAFNVLRNLRSTKQGQKTNFSFTFQKPENCTSHLHDKKLLFTSRSQ